LGTKEGLLLNSQAVLRRGRQSTVLAVDDEADSGGLSNATTARCKPATMRIGGLKSLLSCVYDSGPCYCLMGVSFARESTSKGKKRLIPEALEGGLYG
jgi:hypothetical protein